MGDLDGNKWGPALTGEDPPETYDEQHELAAELEEERLVDETPDPNRHGPAVTGTTDEEE